MTYARLIRANAFRNKKRTFLTMASVVVAFFLYGTLRSVVTTLEAAKEVGSESHLIVTSATGITFTLPEAHTARLAATPGVGTVSWANWFGGYYQDPADFFAQIAIDPESYLALYPEIEITSGSREAFLQDRTGVIVGKNLMEKYGWELDRPVTLKGQIFPGDWQFTIRAVYTATKPSIDNSTMFFQYKYLYERGGQGVSPGWFVLGLTDPSQAATVASAIDAQFKNSSAPTKTQTEKAFQASFLTMFGNIGFLVNAIGTAVFFAILFVSANTMMMSARERVGEVAILKTLGFSNRRLSLMVVIESVGITLIGGGIGLLLARLVFSGENPIQTFFPGFGVTGETIGAGLLLALVLGLVSGAIPAWQSARLSVVDALRRVA